MSELTITELVKAKWDEHHSKDSSVSTEDRTDVADGLTDSREQLEGDIDWWLNRWPGMGVSIGMIKAEVLKWVDRAFLLGRASLDDELAEVRDDLGTANGALELAVKNELTLETICAELRDDLERAEKERDALAHDLEECGRDRDFWKAHSEAFERRCKDAESEREHWREGLGAVTDAAAEIQRIMDRYCTSGKGDGVCQSPANGRRTRNRGDEGGKPDGGGSSGVYSMPRQQITTDYMQTE